MSAVEEAVEEARKQDGFVCWWLVGGGWRRKSGTESGGKRRRREIESEMKAKGKRISGLPIAFQNDRENDLLPRRAAPVGALCEKCHPKAQ